MKSTLTSSVLITTILFMFLLLSAIVAVAFFIPVQSAQSNTEAPMVIDTGTAVMEASSVTPAETEEPATSALSAAPAETQFTLKTSAGNGKLLYMGIGGSIDGVVNPDLIVQPNSTVHITLINGDGMTHDLFLPNFNTKTEYVRKIGDQVEIVLEIGDMQPGSYVYYCTLPGHRKAGQEGKLIVGKP